MKPVDDAAIKPSGLDQMRAWLESGSRPGISVSLDFDLVEIGEGTAGFSGIPGDHAYNPIGSVHGGYAATLLDSACGCAVHTRLSATQAYTTLELKVAYHKGISRDTGRVFARGKVLTMGRRVAFAEAQLVDEAGRLYASATSTLLIFDA